MGGLRRQEKTKQVGRIPLLGDFPIIGGLFKSTNTVTNNSELIVLISPHIYKGEPVPHEAIAKYNELKDGSLLKKFNEQRTKKD
jgi:type II secretory pathway component GspD/PulD (secretin)